MTTSGTALVTLPTDTQILITREFDAPAHLVYRAFTEPELIKRWWSGGMGEVTIADVDLRVGGRWRYVLVTDDGAEVAFHGEYREITPDALIVCTEVYEGAPGSGAALCTYTFTGSGGRSTVAVLSEFQSREIRDIVVDSGMEAGVQAGWDILEQIAVSLSS